MAALVRSGRVTRSPGAWRQSRLPGCGASHRHDPGASHTLNGKIMMALAGARLPALHAACGHTRVSSGMITGKYRIEINELLIVLNVKHHIFHGSATQRIFASLDVFSPSFASEASWTMLRQVRAPSDNPGGGSATRLAG